MAGSSGTKEIATRYPCVDGIIAGTTTQKGHIINTIPETKSNVLTKDKKGING